MLNKYHKSSSLAVPIGSLQTTADNNLANSQ